MKEFLVNKNAQSNGDHEVHKDDCDHIPEWRNRYYLGFFQSCEEAVLKAKKEGFTKVNGCFYCCRDCHTT